MALLVSIAIYFIPSLIAYARRHKHRQAIGILNLVFGWTGVGWVICLVWSILK